MNPLINSKYDAWINCRITVNNFDGFSRRIPDFPNENKTKASLQLFPMESQEGECLERSLQIVH